MTVHRVRPARVYRFYRGGAMIDRLRGEPARDGEFPEDWVASVTAARNPGRDEPEAGLARLEDGRLLRDALAEDPAYWGDPRVLVKLLDPAHRLPVHAHPSRAFAREHLGSECGKTEAWIVIATRGDDADAWLGLREAVASGQYREWIERQDTESLLGSLNHVRAKAGDVLFVPAGVPHAIGGGALIVELQEPTDFSAGRFAVLLVLEGEGELDGQRARAGDAFVIPAAAHKLDARGDLCVLRCLGPENGGTS